MDGNNILGPNIQQKPAVRAKVNLTGLRIEIEMVDLYGQKDYIHATHLANETLSINAKDLATLSPKEVPRLAADISKQLLEMIEQRYILP